MPKITEKELRNLLKEKKFGNCYVFFGKESAVAKKIVSYMVKVLISPANVDFNYCKFSHENVSLNEVKIAACTVPFLAERRVVFLHDLEVENFKKKDFEGFKELVDGVPFSSILVVSVGDKNLDEKNCSKLKKLISENNEKATVVEFLEKSVAELCRILIKHVQKNGGKISGENVRFLIERVGKDLEFLTLELDKLCAFKNGLEITREDVVSMTNSSVEGNAFLIVELILKNEPKKAVEVLNNLLNSNVNEFLIFGAIGSCFMDVYRAKCFVLKYGDNFNGMVKFFDFYKSKSFKLKKAAKICKNYSISVLRSFLIKLSDVDYRLKTSNFCSELLLTEFIFFAAQKGDI